MKLGDYSISAFQQILLLSCVAGGFLSGLPTQAQMIQIDGTTATTPTNCATTCVIQGTTRQANNLFHSFLTFSVDSGQTVLFANPSGVDRIFSRVTGTQPSTILGTLGVQNAANPTSLFFINPNGIVWGENSSLLNLSGSLIASTASSLQFADGREFSAVDSTQPFLTIAVPIGLQFGGRQGSIVRQGFDNITTAAGNAPLRLPSNQTLAFVGGDVLFDGGVVQVRSTDGIGGRLEIGAVAGEGRVGLTPSSQGWVLDYSQVDRLGNVQLSAADLSVTGAPSGGIQIQAQTIGLSNASNIFAITRGDNVTGGDVLLQTGTLSIQESSQIQVAAFPASSATVMTGNAGNLTIVASDSVQISGAVPNFPSALLARNSDGAQRRSNGNAGNLTIQTKLLQLQAGAQISASTATSGQGGVLTVVANQVALTGTSSDGLLESGLFSQATETATGNAGSLVINTESLTVRDGAQISTRTLNTNGGRGGDLLINAQAGSVEVTGRSLVTGAPSLISAGSLGSGEAGNLQIRTGQVRVQEGATVSVSASGSGAAGNLSISAPVLLIDNQGRLAAETTSGQGNIALQTQDLRLRRGSSISTNASGTAPGGNITIAADTLVAFPQENSDITANAGKGPGGRITIQAQGIFGTTFRSALTPDSDITATSDLGPDFSGTVTLQTPEVDPSKGLVNLETQVVDPTTLIAQDCSTPRQRAASRFVVTGRGGLPPSPIEALAEDLLLPDLGQPLAGEKTTASLRADSTQPASASQPLVEAQGWVVNPQGKIVLLDRAPNATLSRPSFGSPTTCNAS